MLQPQKSMGEGVFTSPSLSLYIFKLLDLADLYNQSLYDITCIQVIFITLICYFWEKCIAISMISRFEFDDIIVVNHAAVTGSIRRGAVCTRNCHINGSGTSVRGFTVGEQKRAKHLQRDSMLTHQEKAFQKPTVITFISCDTVKQCYTVTSVHSSDFLTFVQWRGEEIYSV